MDKEQIKKLALQAGKYTSTVYIPPVRSKTPGKIWEDGHVCWHDIFNEKFAELVAEQAMKYGPCYQMGYADGAFAEREACAKLIEEDGLAYSFSSVTYGQYLAQQIRARGNK
jgi:hypothetical protein